MVCRCQATVVLDGRARAGLGLQAPVRGVEEEHQAAAEEDTQAGHQQHGHWGDTASLPEAHVQQAGAAAEPQPTPLTMTTG